MTRLSPAATPSDLPADAEFFAQVADEMRGHVFNSALIDRAQREYPGDEAGARLRYISLRAAELRAAAAQKAALPAAAGAGESRSSVFGIIAIPLCGVAWGVYIGIVQRGFLALVGLATAVLCGIVAVSLARDLRGPRE